MFIFFVISFITNILGPIIPDIIVGFGLNLFMAAFLPFAFFIAYGLMSIPSGILVERFGEKWVITTAFIMSFLGSLLFALIPVFSVALCSLFIIGIGMAMLQVAINPLLRIAGGEENFSFNSVLAQLIFGLASFISPQVYSYLVKSFRNFPVESKFIQFITRLVPVDLPWVSLYWVFTAISLLLVIIMAAVNLPEVKRQENEKIGAWAIHQDLFRNKTGILFFLSIFAYVGSEQGVANWISKLLS